MKEIKKGSTNSFMIFSKWKILWLSKTHSRKLLQSLMTTTMTGALSLTAVGRSKLERRVDTALHPSVCECWWEWVQSYTCQFMKSITSKRKSPEWLQSVTLKCYYLQMILFSFPAKVIKCQNITEKEILLLQQKGMHVYFLVSTISHAFLSSE